MNYTQRQTTYGCLQQYFNIWSYITFGQLLHVYSWQNQHTIRITYQSSVITKKKHSSLIVCCSFARVVSLIKAITSALFNTYNETCCYNQHASIVKKRLVNHKPPCPKIMMYQDLPDANIHRSKIAQIKLLNIPPWQDYIIALKLLHSSMNISLYICKLYI